MALTPNGVELIDRLFGEHMANEHRLLEGLTDDERSRLAGLLERGTLLLGV